MSLIMIFVSFCGLESTVITLAVGLLLLANYCLCAGLLTFEDGPATYVSNSYLSAWSGFFLSLALFGSALKKYLTERFGWSLPSAGVENSGE